MTASFIVPRPSPCAACQGGKKGMDYCEVCAGTGTVFKVGAQIFPDTKDGYYQAEQALERQRIANIYVGCYSDLYQPDLFA